MILLHLLRIAAAATVWFRLAPVIWNDLFRGTGGIAALVVICTTVGFHKRSSAAPSF